MQRLDKFLSAAGIAGRKELRSMIRAGRVSVNGCVCGKEDTKIDEAADKITVDGAAVANARMVVLVMNKPKGYVTSTEDPRDKTVMELLPPPYRQLGVYPVGRLDKETEGLLLFTNDGALAHRIISPKHGVVKQYYAEHEGTAGVSDVEAFAKGLTLRDETVCLPARLEPLGEGKSRIYVQEGKYHQVRRMMASRGMPVLELKREKEGEIALNDLLPGGVRELTPAEIQGL